MITRAGSSGAIGRGWGAPRRPGGSGGLGPARSDQHDQRGLVVRRSRTVDEPEVPVWGVELHAGRHRQPATARHDARDEFHLAALAQNRKRCSQATFLSSGCGGIGPGQKIVDLAIGMTVDDPGDDVR